MRKARRVYGRFTAPTLCVAVLLAGAVSAQANDRAADDAFWNTVKSCRDADEVCISVTSPPACCKGAGLSQEVAVGGRPGGNERRILEHREVVRRDEVSLYLEKFPKGRHVAEARACLKKLQLADEVARTTGR